MVIEEAQSSFPVAGIVAMDREKRRRPHNLNFEAADDVCRTLKPSVEIQLLRL